LIRGKPISSEAKLIASWQQRTLIGNKFTEGRMTEENEEKDRESRRIEQELRKARARHTQFLLQKIRLRNGAEMELAMAEATLFMLREMQHERPKQFEALVSIVKPRGATKLPNRISEKAVANLKRRGIFRPPRREEYAAVLDAAYMETKEGPVLRDPIDYPNKQFAQQWQQLEEEQTSLTVRAILDSAKRRKERGEDDGPSR
jgi:hypothetical protein